MKLQDLSTLFARIQEDCKQIPILGTRLSESFKTKFEAYIHSEKAKGGYQSVTFGTEITCLISKNNKISYIPIPGFFFAHKLSEYYEAIMRYKKAIEEIIRLDDASEYKKNGTLSDDAANKIENSSLEPEEKEFIKRFLTNYSWWGGGKSVDRSDFYISSLMACGNLQAESQSAIAELAQMFAQNSDLKNAFLLHDTPFQPLQQIFYGAPGTGKSHTIDTNAHVAEAKLNNRVIRTTFHPDSDYSSFVGCYKPIMQRGCRENNVHYSFDELIHRLNTMKEDGKSHACHRFSALYWRSIEALNTKQRKDLIKICALTESMDTEVLKGVAAGREIYEKAEENISYTFVAQAFLKAYVKAWENLEKPVFLVIEEINRGNCAQVFGDMFQLLDRDDAGWSNYEIYPSEDIQKFLAETLSEVGLEMTAHGKKMKFPPNLFIWATMNTSDQSLFPMDSAFKRRWDWRYTPIADEEKGWKIKVNEHTYDWWAFLSAINLQIFELTKREDKQLGYFFAKADEGIISAERFVNKVLFYLYTDVFKDEDLPNCFQKAPAFTAYFTRTGIDEEKVDEILQALIPTENTEA